MRRYLPGGLLGSAAGIALAVACTDVSTDPEEIASLEFLPAPAPSVVLGDTLRDTTGAVAPLIARAYNVQGDVIATAPITFTAVDPGITIDAAGRVLGDSIRTNTSRVVATTAGGLQSAPQLLLVVPRPDTVRNLATSLDTLRPSASVASRQSQPIRVRVLHDREAASPADSVVPRYLVRFSIGRPTVAPLDPKRPHLINDGGRLAQVDTTDATGVASLRLELGDCALEKDDPPPTGDCSAPITERDSVAIDVRVTYKPGEPVVGSPLRIWIIVFPVSFGSTQ